jgi:hypothetical protein
MTERYEYRPPFGFDIRVCPDGARRRGKPQERSAGKRKCEWGDCERKGEHRAPKSPKEPNTYRWFCQEHARDYNAQWNFFEGMSDEEVAQFQREASLGHRPTWKLGERGTASARGASAAKEAANGAADPFGLFGEGAVEKPKARKLTRLQREAFEQLNLDEGASLRQIKARYKELLKRFHPDTNGGDRSAEGHLRRVIKAYQVLKASGFC